MSQDNNTEIAASSIFESVCMKWSDKKALNDPLSAVRDIAKDYSEALEKDIQFYIRDIKLFIDNFDFKDDECIQEDMKEILEYEKELVGDDNSDDRQKELTDLINHCLSEVYKNIKWHYVTASFSLLHFFDNDIETKRRAEKEIDNYIKNSVDIYIHSGMQKRVIARSNSQQLMDILIPLDKFNKKIWGFKPEKDKENKDVISGTIDLKSAEDKSNDDVYATFKIIFNSLENARVSSVIEKYLTKWDWRVYLAICNRYYQYNERYISIGQIYHAMGYDIKITRTTFDNIYNSIIKMQRAFLEFDNSAEAEVYDYEYFTFKGYVLPCNLIERRKLTDKTERDMKENNRKNTDVDFVLNGRVIDTYIEMLSFPPLFLFAISRDQYTTIKRKIMLTPGMNFTNNNIALHDYLIGRVSQVKRARKKHIPTNANIILKKKLYEDLNIKKRYEFTRINQSVIQILKYWKSEKIIKKFEEQNDRYILTV